MSQRAIRDLRKRRTKRTKAHSGLPGEMSLRGAANAFFQRMTILPRRLLNFWAHLVPLDWKAGKNPAGVASVRYRIEIKGRTLYQPCESAFCVAA